MSIFPPLHDYLDSDADEQKKILDILHKHILEKLAEYSIEQLKDYQLSPTFKYLETVEEPKVSPKKSSPKASPKRRTPSPPKMTDEERKTRISERKKKRQEKAKAEREKEEKRKAKYQKEKEQLLREKEAEEKRKREEEEDEEREAKLSPRQASKVQKEHQEFLQKVKKRGSKLNEMKVELQNLIQQKLISGVDKDKAIDLSGKISEAMTKSQLEKLGQEIQKLKPKTPPKVKTPSPRRRTPSPEEEDDYVPVRTRAISPPRVRDIMRSTVSITPPPEEEEEDEEEYQRPQLDIDTAFEMLEDF